MVAGLFVALGFALNPAIGVALMVLESAIVLANLYHIKQQDTVSLVSHSERREEETTSKVLNSLGVSSQSSLEQHELPEKDVQGYSVDSTFNRSLLHFFAIAIIQLAIHQMALVTVQFLVSTK